MQVKTDIEKKTLIGKSITITSATNRFNIGISGIVDDETKNTITVNGKKLIKKNIHVKFDNYIVDGKILEKSIEERIKSR